MKKPISTAQWVIAAIATAVAVFFAAALAWFAFTPGLGDGPRRIEPVALLLLLPPASYGLVALCALRLPEIDRLAVAAVVSALLLLPAVIVGIAIQPVIGLGAAAVLGLPLLILWLVLFHRADECSIP
jgi:hypothetical protein